MCTFLEFKRRLSSFQADFQDFLTAGYFSLDENVPGESRTASHEILKTFQTFLCQTASTLVTLLYAQETTTAQLQSHSCFQCPDLL